MEKFHKAKVIFLDRDGVINKDPMGSRYGYVTRWDEFKFLPGVKMAVKKLTLAGYKIYVISNQAGISKGYFTRDALKEITSRMTGELEKSGGKIKKVFYCTHKNEDNCDCRKPKAGLFKKVLKKEKVSIENSFFIGDSIRDVQAGKTAGCETILVLSGKEKLADRKQWQTKPDYVKRNLLDAVNWVLKSERMKKR
ncbi:MAG: D-glycero-beta-D-manno-heptose 1,7-bisphosphate 7-phosphatase [Candidatus Omnitrophota bacterium]